MQSSLFSERQRFVNDVLINLYSYPEEHDIKNKDTTDNFINLYIFFLIREERLELSHHRYWYLKPARLPIPPLSHCDQGG